MSRDWVFLPPAYRPIVFALSSALVALAVWDCFHRTEDIIQDVPRAEAASRPTVLAEEPLEKDAVPMPEEERSKRNEEYMAGIEKEKLSMGISSVLPASNIPVLVSPAGKRASKPSRFAAGSPIPAAAQDKDSKTATPMDYAAGVPSDDAGLVFTDGASLSSSWTLLGLPGNYPAVDYWTRRAVVLKRSSTKILEVRAAKDRVEVYFRLLHPDEASDPAQDRFATLPLEPKPVSLLLLPR